ncbi:MAG: glycoside hydrolase family 2 TIM barrel-domain containing protein [Paludibacter sp.]
MERTRVSHVWVDGTLVGSDSLLCVKQQYDLTSRLKPGKHLLTVCVDNGSDCGLPKEIGSSHMWTDETQTNWNGILGEISLEAKNEIFIRSVKTIPNIDNNTVELNFCIENRGRSAKKSAIEISVVNEQTISFSALLKKGLFNYRVIYPLGNNARHWNEYSPDLYRLGIQLKTNKTVWDSCSTIVGLRKFSADGKFFSINGQYTFLRGKHNACVFPLTGYAPMQKEEWMKYFDILKRYGFNHVRFHSWCPPEAAFEAADASGFYLQPELPFWGGVDSSMTAPINRFLLREGKAILNKYANHPSFVLFSNGNELWGKVASMKQLTDSLRNHDNRPLFTFGTNYHSGWSGASAGEDYLIACRVGGKNDDIYESHVRSSFAFVDAKEGGILNALYPNTNRTLESGVEMTNVPVVSHETGQFQMYPDPKEIQNYTGVLLPQNLEIFIQRVREKAGTAKYQQYF